MSTSGGFVGRGMPITVLALFIAAAVLVSPAIGQFGRLDTGRGGMKTVNYDYKGQKYQMGVATFRRRSICQEDGLVPGLSECGKTSMGRDLRSGKSP
jgi:hypothetical protein